MTTLIEGLLLDRLVREVERRVKAVDAEAAVRTEVMHIRDVVLLSTTQDLAAMISERDRIAQTRDRLISEADDRRKRTAVEESLLYELWEAADDLRKELTLARVRKDLAAPIKRLHEALRAAHDACGRIPF